VRFDVLVVGDFRFPGGTSTSIASEVRALAAAGYSVGLLPAAGSVLRYPHPFNGAIAALVDRGQAALVPQKVAVDARLCALHHPQVFATYPARPWSIRAGQTLLVVHHPPVDAAGAPAYDWQAIGRVVGETFGPHVWAPVGPKVRAAFRGIDNPPILSEYDWLNVIDVAEWALPRDGFLGARPVLGRHSRPDPVKWPGDRATFLQAYPDDPGVAVRLMGYGAALDSVVGRRPANWEVLPFGAQPVRQFLASLDFFVYFHGATWIEAFGRAILEALASGAVAVLPRHFEPLFGEAAVYGEPGEVRDIVQRLHGDPVAFQRQSACGTAVVRDRFGPERAVARVEALIGRPRRTARPVPAEPAPTGRVMFFTSNGVGMGHLTRALAVARRLPRHVRPVVVSMSKAFGICAEADGIHAEYLPYHRSVGMDPRVWDDNLERELGEVLAFHEPDVFVFDGNVPYPGLTRALARVPHLWRVWQRRALWAPDSGELHIAQEDHFDAVIEPGEVAAALDRGLTTRHRSRTVAVAPILYLRDGEALSRRRARLALDLPEDGLAVLLQFGSGNNFDISSPRGHAIARLGRVEGVHLVNADWLIGNERPALPASVRQLRRFPFAAYLAAFDFAVGAAGYNSFHENLRAGLPTLFVPNENPEQDEQWRRARYAEMRGLALAARSDDPQRLDAGLTALLDPRQRAGIRAACLDLTWTDGADRAARYLADLTTLRRAWNGT
jgi:hypothetical protein